MITYEQLNDEVTRVQYNVLSLLSLKKRYDEELRKCSDFITKFVDRYYFQLEVDKKVTMVYRLKCEEYSCLEKAIKNINYFLKKYEIQNKQ